MEEPHADPCGHRAPASNAEEYTNTYSSGGYYQRCSVYTGKGGTQRYCFTSGSRSGDRSGGGNAPTMTAEEIAEQACKWEEFCKPRYEVDALGMERAVYAHEGCDTGRSKE